MSPLYGLALLMLFAACSDGSAPRRSVAEVLRDRAPGLMEIDHVQGVFEGVDEQGGPCIVVMVDEPAEVMQERLPAELEGYPVRIRETGAIVPQE